MFSWHAMPLIWRVTLDDCAAEGLGGSAWLCTWSIFRALGRLGWALALIFHWTGLCGSSWALTEDWLPVIIAFVRSKFWTQIINHSVSSISSQKVLVLPVEKHWIWETVYSFKGAWWAPIGLKFLWKLRNFTKLTVLCTGQEKREGHFRVLDWSATSWQRKIAEVIEIIVSDANDSRAGKSRGTWQQVWPDLSLNASSLSFCLSLTHTLGHLSSDFFFIINLNTECIAKCQTF